MSIVDVHYKGPLSHAYIRVCGLQITNAARLKQRAEIGGKFHKSVISANYFELEKEKKMLYSLYNNHGYLVKLVAHR